MITGAEGGAVVVKEVVAGAPAPLTLTASSSNDVGRAVLRPVTETGLVVEVVVQSTPRWCCTGTR